ncbi:MAG: MmgE/PrpD family protein [Steroidobacteraceae bacterium]
MLHAPLEVEDQTGSVGLVAAIADYAASYAIDGDSAIQTARHCLIDALAQGLEVLRDPSRALLIGPLVPGALMPGGARVPGTSLELDPAQAAFCTSLMLCRPVNGSPWLSSLSGSAGDSFGAILATADFQARKATMEGTAPLKVRDMLAGLVKGLEIQGLLAPEVANASPTIGETGIRAARVAASAVATAQMGGTPAKIITAVSHACIEGSMFLDAAERLVIGRADLARAESAGRAVRYACQAMATGRPSYLTPDDVRAVDLAGTFISAHPSALNKAFRTGVIDRLSRDRTAQQAAEVATRFRATVERYFPARQAERIEALFAAPGRLDDLPVNELLAALVTNGAR